MSTDPDTTPLGELEIPDDRGQVDRTKWPAEFEHDQDNGRDGDLEPDQPDDTGR
jgi:hypothetical protein